VLEGEAQPEEVAQLAASLPANRWVWRTIKEGSKGPLVARFARVRVMAVMTLMILVHCFLVRMQLRLKKGAGPDPAPSAGAAARGFAQAGN
jgi:hypothetical protein